MRRRLILVVGLALLPPLIAAIYNARTTLGMPYWDGWALVPYLQKMAAGQLTLQDLWAPHNEHRILLPRLVMLGLARLTGWNDSYEVALNFGLASATGLALMIQWRSTAARQGWSWLSGLVPLLSLNVFALTQWENWGWGWEIVYFLYNLAALAALLVLVNWDGRWTRWLAAVALGLAATCSLGMGLLIWPAGLLLLALPGRAARPRRAWAAGLWALIGAGTYALYFTNYPHLSDPNPLQVLLQQPVDLAHYIFNYLGAPVLNNENAYVAGVIGVIGWWAAAAWLARRAWPNLRPLLPYWTLGLFIQAGAAMVAVSRLQFTTDQALSPRYVTLTYPFWFSLAVMLYWVGAAQPAAPRASGWRILGRAQTWTSLALLAIGVQVIVCSGFGAAFGYSWRYQAVRSVRAAALAGAPLSDEMLSAVYPVPAQVRPWLEYLRQEHLSLFHQP